MFRLIIFTENESHFVLPLVGKICSELSGEMTIAAIVVSERFGNCSVWSNIKRFYPLMRFKGLVLTTIDHLRFKLLGTIRKNYVHSLRSISHGYNIPLYLTPDVNNKEFEQTLKSLDPDLGVSISFGQIFKSNIIHIPRKGIINLHASLLPNYRGLMPNFWVLLNGEKETGITIHYIDEGVDTGRIILQERFSISPQVTYCELVRLSKEIGGKCLINTIRKIQSGDNVATLPVKGKETYYGFPKKEHFDTFWKQGLRYR